MLSMMFYIARDVHAVDKEMLAVIGYLNVFKCLLGFVIRFVYLFLSVASKVIYRSVK